MTRLMTFNECMECQDILTQQIEVIERSRIIENISPEIFEVIKELKSQGAASDSIMDLIDLCQKN